MIQTTRLNDSTMIINSDLIEVIEATPDTVITLIDGTRFVVREPPEEIVRRIQRYRAGVLSLRDDPLLHSRPSAEPTLSVVHGDASPGAES